MVSTYGFFVAKKRLKYQSSSVSKRGCVLQEKKYIFIVEVYRSIKVENPLNHIVVFRFLCPASDSIYIVTQARTSFTHLLLSSPSIKLLQYYVLLQYSLLYNSLFSIPKIAVLIKRDFTGDTSIQSGQKIPRVVY